MYGLTFEPVLDRDGNPTGVEVALDGDTIVTRAPIAQKPSKSFKNILLATTSGNNKVSNLKYDGKDITVNLNAYVPPTRK